MPKNAKKPRNPYVLPMILGRKGSRIPSKKEKLKNQGENFNWLDKYFDECDETTDGYTIVEKE